MKSDVNPGFLGRKDEIEIKGGVSRSLEPLHRRRVEEDMTTEKKGGDERLPRL